MSAPAVTVVDAFARLTLRLRLSVNAVFPTGLPCESLVVTRTTTSSPFFRFDNIIRTVKFCGVRSLKNDLASLDDRRRLAGKQFFVHDGIIELVPELRLTALKSRCSVLLLPVVLER